MFLDGLLSNLSLTASFVSLLVVKVLLKIYLISSDSVDFVV